MVEYIIGRWPVLVIFGISGALLAYVLSFRLPPMYEATAILSVALNFDREPPIKLSERDRAEGKLAGYFLSDAVLRRALLLESDSGDPGNTDSLDAFRGQVRLERKQSRWEITVTDHSPVVAANRANAWASAADEAFWEAHAHALKAGDLQFRLKQLELRLAEARESGSSTSGQVGQIEQVETLIEQLRAQVSDELRLAQGVVTFMTLNVSNLAPVPANPVARDVRVLVVTGNILGILAGVVLLAVSMNLRGSLRPVTGESRE